VEKISEAPASLVAARFEGWRRVFNPFFWVIVSGADTLRLRVRWRRVGSAFLAATLGFYVALAGAAFLFIRYQQHIAAVSYVDFLLPSRWTCVRVARGDHQIAAAQKLAGTGQRLQALLLIRGGVAQSPANRDGRLLLAQLLLEAGRPELARQVLLDGLAFHHADPDFLRPLFSFLFQRQEDARVIAIARKYLPQPPTQAEPDRLCSLAAAIACFFRGDYDLAEDFLRTPPSLAASRDGRLLAAKIDSERGYHDLALLRLRELAAAHPDDAEIHAELVSRLDHADRHDEVRRTALAFQIAHPALPGPRLELLRAYHRTGDRDRAAREIDAFLRDFATDAGALLALADFAANTGDAPLARRLTTAAREHQFPWEPHAILTVEALVVARDFRGALDASRALLHDNPDWTDRYGPVLGSLQAIAHFGLGDTDDASLLLTRYLNQSYLRAENLLAIAQRLVDVDAADYARQTLIRAIAADPLNQAALTRLVELDLNLNRIDELPAHLARLLAMRQPSPDILRVAQYKFGSDLFLFSAERPAALAAIRAALEKTSRTAPRL
jgi:tetratricopeptide (TPR) repeat protein